MTKVSGLLRHRSASFLESCSGLPETEASRTSRSGYYGPARSCQPHRANGANRREPRDQSRPERTTRADRSSTISLLPSTRRSAMPGLSLPKIPSSLILLAFRTMLGDPVFALDQFLFETLARILR